MKKISLLFSTLAFALAVAGAFAFTTVPATPDTAWIDTSESPDVCVPFETDCGVGLFPCMRFVPDAGGIEQIVLYKPNLAECVELQEPVR